MQAIIPWSAERCLALSRALQCIADLHETDPQAMYDKASSVACGYAATPDLAFAGLLCM